MYGLKKITPIRSKVLRTMWRFVFDTRIIFTLSCAINKEICIFALKRLLYYTIQLNFVDFVTQIRVLLQTRATLLTFFFSITPVVQ